MIAESDGVCRAGALTVLLTGAVCAIGPDSLILVEGEDEAGARDAVGMSAFPDVWTPGAGSGVGDSGDGGDGGGRRAGVRQKGEGEGREARYFTELFHCGYRRVLFGNTMRQDAVVGGVSHTLHIHTSLDAGVSLSTTFFPLRNYCRPACARVVFQRLLAVLFRHSRARTQFYRNIACGRCYHLADAVTAAGKAKHVGARGREGARKIRMSPTDALVELMLLPMTAAKPSREGEVALTAPLTASL